MSFDTLGLSDKVVAAVKAAGYAEPTPIQAQAIPHVLARRDVVGIAQTGTGKTASFVLPMLNILEKGRARARMPRTLILEPTRELAAQVEENFARYGVNHKLTLALLIGGVSFDEQDKKITRGADVLIATPGRLLDHFER
ncbi:MAG TPA: DEAD/DEAH box helicase, partial [Afifellaceae bacterium]|nr:DEAD/DEAH box helicase [Afifellaceae bacterium]